MRKRLVQSPRRREGAVVGVWNAADNNSTNNSFERDWSKRHATVSETPSWKDGARLGAACVEGKGCAVVLPPK